VTTHRHPHPRESLERCALRAQLRDDPQLGTAFPAARLLLVEQPGPWGETGLRTSHFGPAAGAVEARANAAGLRLEAIRRPGRTPPDAARRWAIADTRDGRQWVRWGEYHDPAELLTLDLADPPGTDDHEPIYLVCTHSKHDACCALRGRPVAAALHEIRPGRVFECSHVGGDRFAANVLVLPTGLLYGRVLPFAAPEFVAAADGGEVVGALLRGRIGLPPAAQAALAFAHEHLAVTRHGELRVVATGQVVRGNARVRLRWPRGDLDVTVRVELVAADGLTCRNPGPNRYVAYRPIRIDPVED
jgi:hypothetical protein